ncbi:hypothetical protein LOC67_23475 [Stieleria sp. JC731]|uniref:hypothetical protein n=1 Tax=Pirellulaceae TaxID=2691357 RepID=UPI001E63F717|nr:hypothetical protein [Stieleria sp. JC731]MCC9603521.1 hypothetical protein [Stieleria sp. JC731]
MESFNDYCHLFAFLFAISAIIHFAIAKFRAETECREHQDSYASARRMLEESRNDCIDTRASLLALIRERNELHDRLDGLRLENVHLCNALDEVKSQKRKLEATYNQIASAMGIVFGDELIVDDEPEDVVLVDEDDDECDDDDEWDDEGEDEDEDDEDEGFFEIGIAIRSTSPCCCEQV